MPVLYELTLAFRCAMTLVVMKDGAMVARGQVSDVVATELIEGVYGLPCQLLNDPVNECPTVIPIGV